MKFRKITGEALLHRYNCALVQGLLLRSEKIKLKLPESGTASLRQLLKYLRFNKLLAKISFDHKKRKSIDMQIDGPLSMFLQTQKYGLNLANFFPAVLHQQEWELDATVRIHKNRTYILQLDQSCGIRSHLRQFLAYVPEEIQKLGQQLAKKLPDWTLSSSNDFVPLSGENMCFPDYLLKHISGKKVPLELFHNWHSAPLLNRLSQLEAQKEAPLLIGINRSLLKNKDVENKLETSSYFTRFGFLFRDVPTAAMLLPRLETWLRSRL
jgi:predicted nuclease of restriction endonuclease-like RecB superfamily